jgi:hypothetical protein
MTSEQLLTLASLYTQQTDLSLRQLGRVALNGNHKFFARLECGAGVNTKSIERAACWLAAHWPPELPWPAGIPIPARRHCDGAANAGIRRSPGAGRG